MQTVTPYFKTPRELHLEHQVSRLERALLRATGRLLEDRGLDAGDMIVPNTTELNMEKAPGVIQLPKVASVTAHKDLRYPDHLQVSARVHSEKPFGINYYTRPGLLTDTSVACQVLAYEHEVFVHKLAKFLTEENDKAEKKQQ